MAFYHQLLLNLTQWARNWPLLVAPLSNAMQLIQTLSAGVKFRSDYRSQLFSGKMPSESSPSVRAGSKMRKKKKKDNHTKATSNVSKWNKTNKRSQEPERHYGNVENPGQHTAPKHSQILEDRGTSYHNSAEETLPREGRGSAFLLGPQTVWAKVHADIWAKHQVCTVSAEVKRLKQRDWGD